MERIIYVYVRVLHREAGLEKLSLTQTDSDKFFFRLENRSRAATIDKETCALSVVPSILCFCLIDKPFIAFSNVFLLNSGKEIAASRH